MPKQVLKPEPRGKKPPKPIRRVGKKKAKALRSYSKVRAEFLTENPICQVDGCNRMSTDVHHKKGKLGKLLTDVLYFLGVCRMCHQRIEISPTWAIENGYSEKRLEDNDMENYL